MDFDPIIKARKVLQPLWDTALLKGRCWGPKKPDNPFSATNITFAFEDELISVSQAEDGKLRVHGFRRDDDTEAGRAVKNLLQKNGLVVAD